MNRGAIVKVYGSPYEQGFQQGKALTETIAKNVKLIKEHFEQANCDYEKYNLFVQKNVTFLQKNYPEQIEEMGGIADGSGLDYKDILFINIPAYFMMQYFPPECSMILARKNATADGGTYLIKNRDMRIGLEQVVIERHYSDGLVISEVSGAGTITYPAIGINNYGLALTTTGFWSKKTHVELNDVSSRHIFVNIHFPLTECKSVAEVVKHVEYTPRMNGLNIIAADKNDAVVIETTRDSMALAHDDGTGVIYRTNHYVFEENVNLNPDKQEYPSTFMRYERIGELLSELKNKIRFQDLFRILSDHKNEPLNSICRHPNSLSSAHTVSTSLVSLEDGELWTTLDNPCLQLPYSCVMTKSQ